MWNILQTIVEMKVGNEILDVKTQPRKMELKNCYCLQRGQDSIAISFFLFFF